MRSLGVSKILGIKVYVRKGSLPSPGPTIREVNAGNHLVTESVNSASC